MLNYFPTPYPGELIYSVLSRYIKRLEMPFYILKETLRKEEEEIIKFNPVIGIQLDKITTQLPNIYPYDEYYFIDNHTVIPLYKMTLNKEEYRKLKYNAVYNYGEMIPLMKSVIAWELRYCSKCIQEDREIYGEAYLHREHQLKGVLFCGRHLQILKAVTINSNKIMDVTMIDLYDSHSVGRGLNSKEEEGALQIAKAVNYILYSEHQIGYREDIRLRFIEKVYEEGEYIFQNKMNMRKIKESIVDKYYLQNNMQGECMEFNKQVNKLLGQRSIHTIKDPIIEIMLMLALFDEIIDLTVNHRERAIDLDARTREILEVNYKKRALEIMSTQEVMMIKSIRSADRAAYSWLRKHFPDWINQFSYGEEHKKQKHTRLDEKHKESISKYLTNNLVVSRGKFLKDNEAACRWYSRHQPEYLARVLDDVNERHRNKLFIEYSTQILQYVKKFPYKYRSQLAKEMGSAYTWLRNNEPEWLRAVTWSYQDEIREVHRQIVREYIKKHPKALKKEVRKEFNTSYEWLIKNDSIWFSGVIFHKSLEHLEKHRTIINQLIQDKPDISRGEVLEKAPVSYMWMKRNKKGWIENKVPSTKNNI